MAGLVPAPTPRPDAPQQRPPRAAARGAFAPTPHAAPRCLAGVTALLGVRRRPSQAGNGRSQNSCWLSARPPPPRERATRCGKCAAARGFKGAGSALTGSCSCIDAPPPRPAPLLAHHGCHQPPCMRLLVRPPMTTTNRHRRRLRVRPARPARCTHCACGPAGTAAQPCRSRWRACTFASSARAAPQCCTPSPPSTTLQTASASCKTSAAAWVAARGCSRGVACVWCLLAAYRTQDCVSRSQVLLPAVALDVLCHLAGG